MKVKIATIAFNKPNFIEYQYKSLKKFIQHEFEYAVYNNAIDVSIRNEINKKCHQMGISVIEIPSNTGDNSTRAGNSLNFALQNIAINFKDVLLLIDSDVFLVDYYDVLKSLGTNSFMGISQVNEQFFYYSNQFLIFNIQKLPDIDKIDFLPGTLEGIRIDCGGMLYTYFIEHPEVVHKGIHQITNNRICFGKYDFNDDLKIFFQKEYDILDKNFAEIFDRVFLHLRAGSNWINIDEIKQREREENLFNLINKLTR
jgi:hypothetical protein